MTEGCNGTDGAQNGGDSTPMTGDSFQPTITLFCGPVATVFYQSCTACHASTLIGAARNSAPVGVDYDSYTAAVANATRGNIRIQAGTMPPAGPLSATQKALVQAWINDGKLDCQGDGGPLGGDTDLTPGDSFVAPCSTSSYSTAIEGISMRPGDNCIRCHGTDFGVAGTVMGALHDVNFCNGIAGVTVEITDHANRVFTFTTAVGGNFAGTEPLVMPYTARVLYAGHVRAMSGAKSNPGCNSCHTEQGLNGAPGRIIVP
jgi:mono/diheme cytochrome c family protein